MPVIEKIRHILDNGRQVTSTLKAQIAKSNPRTGLATNQKGRCAGCSHGYKRAAQIDAWDRSSGFKTSKKTNRTVTLIGISKTSSKFRYFTGLTSTWLFWRRYYLSWRRLQISSMIILAEPLPCLRDRKWINSRTFPQKTCSRDFSKITSNA